MCQIGVSTGFTVFKLCHVHSDTQECLLSYLSVSSCYRTLQHLTVWASSWKEIHQNASHLTKKLHVTLVMWGNKRWKNMYVFLKLALEICQCPVLFCLSESLLEQRRKYKPRIITYPRITANHSRLFCVHFLGSLLKIAASVGRWSDKCAQIYSELIFFF